MSVEWLEATYPEIMDRRRCALGELRALVDVRHKSRATVQLRGGDLDWSRSGEDYRQAGDKECSKEAHSLDDVNNDGDGVALGEEGRWTGGTLLHVLKKPTLLCRSSYMLSVYEPVSATWST